MQDSPNLSLQLEMEQLVRCQSPAVELGHVFFTQAELGDFNN